MREEDLDWVVYHRIPETGGITAEDLVATTGFESGAVAASLERLERYLLVRRSGEMVHLLSLQESLIGCQCRCAKDNMPFVIENGIIRAKRSKE
ncbi:MAG: MarR family transcriptional regulator [Methanoculleus sp.]|nr:MarR family transcriptional regulator [Methanoculleus sp.]